MEKLFLNTLAVQSYLNNLINQLKLEKLLKRFPAYNRSVHKNYPNLVKEWDHVKNAPLTLKHFTKGSQNKAHWICEYGHQFSALISNRTNGSGCRACRCSNPSHNIKMKYPHLLDEWDYERNSSRTPPLEPDQISPKTNKKAWWICKYCKNKWEARISQRADSKVKYGCPTCSSRRKGVSDTNNFQFCYPNVAKEWHPSRNGLLSPKDITPKSAKKVWWLCSICSHEWEALACNRGKRKKQGCPKCKSSLDKRPELVDKYWDNARNLELGLNPDKLTSQSTKAHWKCDKDSEHIWFSTLQSFYLASRCPHCSKSPNRKVLKKDSFAAKCPQGLKYWDKEKNEELNLDPNNCAPKSNKVAGWICPKHGPWEAKILSVYNGTRCPKCKLLRET